MDYTSAFSGNHCWMVKRWFALVFLMVLAPLVARAEWPPSNVIPSGWGVQLKSYNDSAADLDAIQKLGLKYVRRGFIWAEVEKERGVYDFSHYDKFVADCQARGISILGCIAYDNPNYQNVRTDDGRAGYTAFAVALATRYKDANVIWEIWNEPNTVTFWGRHGRVGNSESYAAEYVALVQAVAPAMHQANPKAVVIGGSMSGLWTESYKWMDYCFKKGMGKTGIDSWSMHPYSTRIPEDYVEAYAHVRAILTSNGMPVDFPLINSERGYPVGKAEGVSSIQPEKTYEFQVWQFQRQFLIDALCGIKLTIWYEWSGVEGFALCASELALKQSHDFIQNISTYRFEHRLPTQSSMDFALVFRNANGTAKLVSWTAPADRKTPGSAVSHPIQIRNGETEDTLQLKPWPSILDYHEHGQGHK